MNDFTEVIINLQVTRFSDPEATPPSPPQEDFVGIESLNGAGVEPALCKYPSR